MKVSIIIPSYNRKASTARAVKSVMEQTYRDFEVLVVDDCSRDEEIYFPEAGYAAQVRVIRQKVNGGVSAARNTGVKEAGGVLVAFLDSDDYWLPGKLERHVALFDQQKDSNHVLLYGSYYTVNDEFWTATPFSPLRAHQAVSDYVFLDYGCMHVNTWLATKEYLGKLPFNPELKQSEDWDVLLRMEAMGGRFVFDPVPGAVRHVDLRDDRLSTRTDVECQWRFIEKNAARLTPRSRAVLESITREQEAPSQSGLALLFSRLKFFMFTPILTTGQRLSLVLAYTWARVTNKIYSKIYRKQLTLNKLA